MAVTNYLYGYLIYLAAMFVSFVVSDALGWEFFEMGVAPTLIYNGLFGIVPFAIGLGCLFLANIFLMPRTHFFVWAQLDHIFVKRRFR